MADVIPFEKLQPCLLDRLTDDDSKNRAESRNQRVISLSRYKQGVLRDLQWLLNASAHLPDGAGDPLDFGNFPEARRSVLNYGTRQLCGLVAPDMRALEEELLEAIQLFEPRILRHSLEVLASLERNVIGIEIRGELWANPVPEQLFIKTKIDLEIGQSLMGDSSHG